MCDIQKSLRSSNSHYFLFVLRSGARFFFFSFVIVETLRKVRAGDGRRTHIESIKTHSPRSMACLLALFAFVLNWSLAVSG
jgi:hypothetical protein